MLFMNKEGTRIFDTNEVIVKKQKKDEGYIFQIIALMSDENIILASFNNQADTMTFMSRIANNAMQNFVFSYNDYKVTE